MNRIKNFASNTPVGFSIFIVLAFIALIIFSAVFTNRYPAESESWYIAGTAARLVSTAIFVALVVSGRSIYPAALLHGLLNIAAQQNLLTASSAAADSSAWFLQTLLMVPLAFIGIYLVWSATRQSSYQTPVNQPDLARN
jgi:hypothetical protein